MKLKSIHLPFKKALCCLCAVFLLLPALSGCGASSGASGDLIKAVQNAQSVEASITLELHGSVNSSDSTSHTTSIKSDGTITSTRSPVAAYHAEYYSSILVDGVPTRESRDFYVLPEQDEYVRYEYTEATEEWTRTTISRSDILSIPRETGLIYDWSEVMAGLTQEDTEELPDGSKRFIYGGSVPSHILQELFGHNVFGSFVYSMEQLLEDKIPCTLTVDAATMLPVLLELDFANEWTVSDMSFDTAYASVSYSNWNQHPEIEVPNRVPVIATDTEAEFYSNFYAWNLFLPYIGGQQAANGTAGNSGQSFAVSWNTFQVRIDGGMTSVPLPFDDLRKIGYSVGDQYSSVIVEPNKYKEGVAVVKGSDKMFCTFYNDDTVPQPISSCKIGCIDISTSNLPDNGIQIYLPEVTLGITKEALVSAYGEPTEIVTSFAADSYIWKGEHDQQSFMAEVSPLTGLVIRLQLKNIPVTGGAQT